MTDQRHDDADVDGQTARSTSHQVDADDLQTSLSDLAALVTGGRSLSETLGRVATYAAKAIPGADGAGVTLLHVDRPDNRVEALAASDPFVSEIDEIQYVTVNEGPCITAALERRTVRSGSLGGEKMWPRFGPRVGRLGIHSALSLPLLIPGQVVGAINVYARAKDVFDDHAQQLGELFAAPAAVAVHNAHILSQALVLTERLQTALATRPVIDEAVGLIRGRTGATSAEARERLRGMSQLEHLKLIDVAQRLVDEAVRRSHARHPQQLTTPDWASESAYCIPIGAFHPTEQYGVVWVRVLLRVLIPSYALHRAATSCRDRHQARQSALGSAIGAHSHADSPALAADLSLLSVLLADPSDDLAIDLADTVLLLAADVRSAVRSFLGLTVTATIASDAAGAGDVVALRFTLLEDEADPRDVATSQRLPLPKQSDGQPRIDMVLYAAKPGALLDLAADLSFLTGRDLADVALDQDRGLAGEDDITGLVQTGTSIYEAIGVLITGGHTREQAYAELDTLAEQAQTDRTTEAARLLAAVTRSGPDRTGRA